MKQKKIINEENLGSNHHLLMLEGQIKKYKGDSPLDILHDHFFVVVVLALSFLLYNVDINNLYSGSK